MTDIVFAELNKGHWNIVLLLVVFAAIFLALKRYVAMNESRHKEHTHLDDILTKNVVELTNITKVHETEISNLKNDVKDVRFEFRIKKTGK